MSATEDTNTHKRSASSTSAGQAVAPPAKRPSTSNLAGLARRDFPYVIFLVLWKDSDESMVLGAYAGLADANAEVRTLAQENGQQVADADTDPLRWETADGVSCWVETHAVKPKTFVKTAPAASGEGGKGKLYQPEEEDDDDEINEEEAQYD